MSALSSPAPSPPRLLRYARKDSVGFPRLLHRARKDSVGSPRLLRRFALLAMREEEVPLAITKIQHVVQPFKVACQRYAWARLKPRTTLPHVACCASLDHA